MLWECETEVEGGNCDGSENGSGLRIQGINKCRVLCSCFPVKVEH